MNGANGNENGNSNGSRAYVYKTPRGKSIVAHVPAHTSYDGFLGALLEKAAAVDQFSSRRRSSASKRNRWNKLNARVRPLEGGRQYEPSGKKQRLSYNSCEEEKDRKSLTSFSGSSLKNYSEMAYIVHNGKILDRASYHKLNNSTISHTFDISLQLRIRGGIDRQNRVGSKFGGGGVSSSQQSERERKDRLRELALETVDLAKDPYLMRNHLGTYECKLCLTLHTNEVRNGLYILIHVCFIFYCLLILTIWDNRQITWHIPKGKNIKPVSPNEP